ncbi:MULTISPECIES: hypothetical protein [Myxococcus]|uniref:hypothetical protein n=1 Tax=Myxococcus TaxID=32 RepID=UPI0013D60784|nr:MULTISPECIES: hypothetical protein [Myxococcus]NVJ23904.1 hypothetical protein [Myxococcus sp. AM011]
MDLEKELEQFRQEAQRLKAGRRSGSLPFPEALRGFAVRYTEHRLSAGGMDVAKSLSSLAPASVCLTRFGGHPRSVRSA